MNDYTFKVNASARVEELTKRVEYLRNENKTLMIDASDSTYERMTKLDQQMRNLNEMNSICKELETINRMLAASIGIKLGDIFN